MKTRTFTGGYDFKAFEAQPREELVVPGIPSKVIIPLQQGFGDELPPLVEAGEKVTAGQIIGRDDETVSSPVHSSVDGTVEEIATISYLGREQRAVTIRTQTVTIRTQGESGWKPPEKSPSDWKILPVEKLEEALYLSGVTSLGSEGIPTSFKSSLLSPAKVRHIIVHGVESDVYNLSLPFLLRGENTSHFVEGLEILQRVMPSAKLHVALNENQEAAIEKLSELLSGSGEIAVCPLSPRYPQEHAEVLVPTVLGEEFPYGYFASGIGVVILDIQAVLQVYEAVVEGKPLIERTVALCGRGFKENLHARVLIGTPLEHLVDGRTGKDEEVRFLVNSPLTGSVLSDVQLPVDCSFSQLIALVEGRDRQLLAFINPGFKKDSYTRTFLAGLLKTQKCLDTNLQGEERPCVFCNFCQGVCPVGIIPHLLYNHVKRNILNDDLLNLRIFNCIDCKLCTYVCPSKIDVAKLITEGKKKLLDEGFDRSVSVSPCFDLEELEHYVKDTGE